MNPLVISFGGAHPATVTSTRRLSWEEYSALLLGEEPVQTPDKASRGWSCPVRFNPPYRDSENFVARYALTFDYDHVTPEQVEHIHRIYAGWEHIAYTTWSHTEEHPRWRLVFPLTRGVTYDEFQAVSRKIAARAGIELAARESHVPAQMMYLPTVQPDCARQERVVHGEWVDPDAVLAEYAVWTDRTEWPHRGDGDGVQALGQAVDPTTKAGVIGAFCRAYSIHDAIDRWSLPYTEGAAPHRLSYADGSRPDGAIVYDNDTKLHSHHDTDPARGQHNAFDLVRLHLFGYLDDEDADLPITERASYKEMVSLALTQPAVVAEMAGVEFDSLPETPEPEPSEEPKDAPLARSLQDVLTNPTKPRWLIRDVLECRTIVLLAGPRGTYKSFLALDWAMRVAFERKPVYVVSAEGGDFDRRAAAWMLHYAGGHAEAPPLYVVERRLDLNSKAGVETIRQDCAKLRIKPCLFILDTFSKLSGGLDENSNSEVKSFIGLLDNGLKRTFDATVLLVAHTGHSNQSRARGASALEADTEAAHIVTREAGTGVMLVSRERFKSSPELPPLVYSPKIVQLDRVDEDGLPITSVILETANPVSVAGRSKDLRKGLGRYQKLIYDVLKVGPRLMPVAAVLDAAEERIPAPDFGRDRRRPKLMSALEKMLIDEVAFKYGNQVSLARTIEEEED